MSDILVFIEHNTKTVSKASLAAITAAGEIASKHNVSGIDAVVLGTNAKDIASSLKYGFNKIFTNEDAKLEKYIFSTYQLAVSVLFGNYKYFVIAATSLGKDLAPRIAGKHDAGQASDITAVNDDGSFRRPLYAGNAFADVEVSTAQKIVTVRATAFDAAAEEASALVDIESFDCSFETNFEAEVLSYDFPELSRPELASAEVVVSGGRALGSSENFEKYMFPLADALNAGIGASRAAVDSGYAPNDWQVGQTGKIVAPNLYIAIGISGAIQHLAGMKDSKVIVAINKDPEAPIFEIADYGLVADLFEVLEPLTAAINESKS